MFLMLLSPVIASYLASFSPASLFSDCLSFFQASRYSPKTLCHFTRLQLHDISWADLLTRRGMDLRSRWLSSQTLGSCQLSKVQQNQTVPIQQDKIVPRNFYCIWIKAGVQAGMNTNNFVRQMFCKFLCRALKMNLRVLFPPWRLIVFFERVEQILLIGEGGKMSLWPPNWMFWGPWNRCWRWLL